MLALTVHNVVRFLVWQRRFKNWLVSAFYVLSVVVIISRII